MVPLFGTSSASLEYAQRCFDKVRIEPWRIDLISQSVTNLFVREYQRARSSNADQIPLIQEDRTRRLVHTCVFSLGCIGHAILDRLAGTMLAPQVKHWRDTFQRQLDKTLLEQAPERFMSKTPQDIRAAIEARDWVALEVAMFKNYPDHDLKQENVVTDTSTLVKKAIDEERIPKLIKKRTSQESKFEDISINRKRQRTVKSRILEDSDEECTKTIKKIKIEEITSSFVKKSSSTPLAARKRQEKRLNPMKPVKAPGENKTVSKGSKQASSELDKENQPQKGVCRTVRKKRILSDDYNDDDIKGKETDCDSMDDWLVDDYKIKTKKRSSISRCELGRWCKSW